MGDGVRRPEACVQEDGAYARLQRAGEEARLLSTAAPLFPSAQTQGVGEPQILGDPGERALADQLGAPTGQLSFC